MEKSNTDNFDAVKSDNKRVRDIRKDAIIDFLTDNVTGRVSDIADLLGIDAAQSSALLSELVSDEIIVEAYDKNGRIYSLKA